MFVFNVIYQLQILTTILLQSTISAMLLKGKSLKSNLVELNVFIYREDSAAAPVHTNEKQNMPQGSTLTSSYRFTCKKLSKTKKQQYHLEKVEHFTSYFDDRSDLMVDYQMWLMRRCSMTKAKTEQKIKHLETIWKLRTCPSIPTNFKMQTCQNTTTFSHCLASLVTKTSPLNCRKKKYKKATRIMAELSSVTFLMTYLQRRNIYI